MTGGFLASALVGAVSAVAVLMGVAQLAIGLRVVLARRPILLSQRWPLALFALALLAQTSALLVPALLSHDLPAILRGTTLLVVLMNLGLIALLSCLMRGWVIYGVTEDSLRLVLREALASLHLPFEEQRSHLHLPSDNTTLQIAAQDELGTATIRVRRGSRALAARVIRALSVQLECLEAPATPGIFHVVWGLLVFTVGCGGAFFLLTALA